MPISAASSRVEGKSVQCLKASTVRQWSDVSANVIQKDKFSNMTKQSYINKVKQYNIQRDMLRRSIGSTIEQQK